MWESWTDESSEVSSKCPGAYSILKLLGVELIRGRLQLEGGAYFKFREMNNIKCLNLSFFLSK